MEWTNSKRSPVYKAVAKEYELETNVESFAAGFNIYKCLLIFIAGSFAGFMLETVWFVVRYGELVERKGVFYGPFSPIYGAGMLMLAFLIHKFHIQKKAPISVFAMSALFGAIFEVICSVLQETIFGTRSWNYSGTFLSIDGRTNFLMAMMWGIVGYFFVFYVYPFINKWIEKIPNKYGKTITMVLTIVLCVDISITALAVGRHRFREEGVPAGNAVEQYLDDKYPSEYVDEFLQE